MRVTSKGQVTIPQEIRQAFGILPNTEVRFEVQKGQIILIKEESSSNRSKEFVDLLKGKATVKMSTDQIMKLTRG